ncbi:MAG: putative serine protease PepD [Acidimicrobiales bacterium]|jgi:putative serine protease PepD
MVLAFLAGSALTAGSFGLGVVVANDDTASQPAPTLIETATPITGQPEASETTPTPTPTPTPAVSGAAQPVAAVAAALGPSVVQVETDQGLGSGVIYGNGLILTNHHVIDGAGSVQIRTSDGRTIAAEVVGSNSRNDIAVLDIGQGSGLPAAELALGRELAVGEQTIAIGSPFQLQQTVTAGIVSALNRPVPNNGGGMTAMIQTDAPINPGNSGGALADANGQVIGINTSIRTDGSSNSNVGIGFAVPIDTAIDVALRITSGAPLEVGVLGVQASTSPNDEVGVVIGEIVTNGAAADAGLVTGDRVISIDGAPVTRFSELVGLVQSHFGGDDVTLIAVRGSQTLTLIATLD